MSARPCTRCGTFLTPEQEVTVGPKAVCASCQGTKTEDVVRWLRWLAIGSIVHSVLIAPLLASHTFALWKMTKEGLVQSELEPVAFWIMYGGFGLLGLTTCGQMVSGIGLLQRRRGAHKLAMFSYVVGLVLVFTFWCAPTSLVLFGAGIKLFRDKHVRAHMDTWV